MKKISRLVLLHLTCFSLITINCNGQTTDSHKRNDVLEDLTAIPDFRSVKLKWIFRSNTDPLGFFITLCEFFKSRDFCFERHLLNRKPKTLLGHDSLWTDGHGHFEAVVYDLRMLTNYTVKVEPMTDQYTTIHRSGKVYGSSGHHGETGAFFTTKGFSAHATNCQANSSDIVVKTGPYFGGKITVESSTDSRCSVYGNRSKEQEIYILRIDHRICGSTSVNDSRIDTVVVVHESSSVVTHNSRRFLVQCTYLPETFTIRASFSIPPEGDEPKRNLNYKELEEALKSQEESNDIFTYEHYKQNHVKDSRMSSVQGPTVLHQNLQGYESQMLVLLVVVIILAILVVLVIGLGLWWYINSHRRRNNMDIETLSTTGSSIIAYHHNGITEADDDILVRRAQQPPNNNNNIFNDPYGYYHARNMNPFCAGQVALVSLKPVKELY